MIVTNCVYCENSLQCDFDKVALFYHLSKTFLSNQPQKHRKKMSGIAYCEIQELKLQLQATSVVCLVIAKSAPHTFESKNDGQSRSVLNITVRDSTRSTINW